MFDSQALPPIVGKASCRTCGGQGRIDVKLNVIELIEIIAPTLETRTQGKIQAIKDIRARWDLGLKQAKEIVEAYQDFSRTLSNSINVMKT